MFSWLNIHKLLETSLLDDEHHILSYTTICKKMFCPRIGNTAEQQNTARQKKGRDMTKTHTLRWSNFEEISQHKVDTAAW